jgi:uncharacterized protein (UPF0335 family)
MLEKTSVVEIGARSGIAVDQLRSFVERVERLEEEIKALQDDKSDIYKEAKSQGFDAKALKAVVAYRRKDPADALDQQAVFETYLDALGTDVATRARAVDAA